MSQEKDQVGGRDTARVILESAVRLACVDGMGAVTARAVALEAGITASAVIYHFKSVANLLSAIYDQVEEDLSAWRAGLLAMLADPAKGLFSAEALGIAALSRLVQDMGLRTILQQELYRAALRGTLSLNQSPLIGLNARVDFWQALWRDTGLKREQAELWAAAADGLVSLPLLDRVPFRREALIAAAMRRMDDRIAGRAIPSTPSETVLPEIVEAPAVPRGKRQIIEAATRLIGREGVDRLTHRKIAAEAGLSLAATTYFYESKDDLIADAFREIQRQAVYAVVQGETQPGHFASTIMLDEQNEERWQLAAMLALNQAAIRYARFDDLALTLRQLRGIDAMRWLRAHGCADADHLDGILWSGVTTSIGEYALCLPASERRRHLDRETARAFGLLFGAR